MASTPYQEIKDPLRKFYRYASCRLLGFSGAIGGLSDSPLTRT